jgi:hypothetical protein
MADHGPECIDAELRERPGSLSSSRRTRPATPIGAPCEARDSGAGVVHTHCMRRIQIYLDERLDERLQAEAARTGRSKASLIRESVATRYEELPALDDDPLSRLVGAIDVEPADIDDVVYGR